MTATTKAVLVRLGVTLLLGLLVGVLVGEGAYWLLRGESENEPRVIEIVIPAGTARQIAMGGPGPALPSMIFTAGDVLMVRNEDEVSHQLGPLWIPPGSTASLNLDRPNAYSMACTFQSSQVLGLDVRPRIRPIDRVQGILAVMIPTWMLLWVYSLVAVPLPESGPTASSIHHRS
ncbi:hypothetical protein QYE77_00335 [Thermanaerothrix sp. 4228-RoL]|jgi:hypothetical protein|uniref:Uncharacterized protein n=1 Tax=Thermanaerothrix solaris TaxID=3058434 RepID=A0ABU3NIL5_9CHLR|nr:hypothetical protein [Thermanaerothrix sp. 4228-RoL]MDT8896698.1 hypothetical protein [Thermanaerothrix sp. 4228-RoL]